MQELREDVIDGEVYVSFSEKKPNVIQQFEDATMALVREFEQKQEIEFEGFTDNCAGVAGFGDVFYFNIHEILYDLETNQPKGRIIDWLYESLNAHQEGKKHINYRSYCMGARFKEDKDEKKS